MEREVIIVLIVILFLFVAIFYIGNRIGKNYRIVELIGFCKKTGVWICRFVEVINGQEIECWGNIRIDNPQDFAAKDTFFAKKVEFGIERWEMELLDSNATVPYCLYHGIEKLKAALSSK